MLTHGGSQLWNRDDDKDSKMNFLFSLNQMSFLIGLFQIMTLSFYPLGPK